MRKIFHNSELRQVNFVDERFYTIDGVVFYPSVTEVLSVYPKGFGFYDWLKKNGQDSEDIKNEAAEKGSKIHQAIEDLLSGIELAWEGFSLDEWLMVLKFVDFYNQVKPTIICNECIAMSHKYRVGGTIDLVCEINGEIWIIDIKTSNGVYFTHELQVAVYAEMWNEMNYPMKVDKTGILWLKAKTKTCKDMQGAGWQVVPTSKPYSELINTWDHVRAIWDMENPNCKPKNLVYPDRIKLF